MKKRTRLCRASSRRSSAAPAEHEQRRSCDGLVEAGVDAQLPTPEGLDPDDQISEAIDLGGPPTSVLLLAASGRWTTR